MALKNKLFFQLLRFGTIGALAASVQFGIVIALVELKLLTPLAANVIGFMFAFQVSYWGHRSWTFNSSIQHQIALPRLFLVAGSSFIANESLFYLLLALFHLPYIAALFLVSAILPIVNFTISKLWVFR